MRAYYVYLNKKRDLQEEVGESVYIETWIHKKKTRKEKVLERLFKFADDFSDLGQRINFFSEDDEVKKYLIQAGSPYGLTVARFQGLKMFMLIAGFFVGGILFILRISVSAIHGHSYADSWITAARSYGSDPKRRKGRRRFRTSSLIFSTR